MATIGIVGAGEVGSQIARGDSERMRVRESLAAAVGVSASARTA